MEEAMERKGVDVCGLCVMGLHLSKGIVLLHDLNCQLDVLKFLGILIEVLRSSKVYHCMNVRLEYLSTTKNFSIFLQCEK